MKISLTSIAFLISTITIAQDLPSSLAGWSYQSAFLMPEHKWESGIVQPFRYGLSKKVEIYSNLLEFPILPNASAKLAFGSWQGWSIASDHTISYPTMYLETARTKGTGGLISPQFDIPFMLAFSNGLIVSRSCGSAALISLHASVTFSVRDSKLDRQATIDLPVFYPRMTHYYDGALIRAGFSSKGAFSRKLLYENRAEIFVVARGYNNFFFENSAGLMWLVGRSLRIRGGYNLSYGQYPFGPLWQLWPTLDVVFGSKYR